jgi:hypothetical protein
VRCALNGPWTGTDIAKSERMSLMLVDDRGVSLPTHSAPAELHRRLMRLTERRLKPVFDEELTPSSLREDADDRWEEERFISAEKGGSARQLENLPDDVDGFISWFEGLKERGPGQSDPLFAWLETNSSWEQMRWFLGQEAAGEAGFDDLLALTQLRMPTRPRLEMARNFWDEMGRGLEGSMHGPLLARLVKEMDAALPLADVRWEPLALANLMMGLCWNRRYAYQAVGALGVIELTAPGRAAAVNAGLKRLSVSAGARKYFALHAHLDIQHAIAWNAEVLRPLAMEDPRIMRLMAEGALLRLNAGARCFARYRRQFGFTGSEAMIAPAPPEEVSADHASAA